MVSIEDRANYQLRINDSPKLIAFNNLLLSKSFTLSANADVNESEEIFFGILNAILANDKTAFETHYNKKNKSHPSQESRSPFVNDDFLIFCLIVGIIKFSEDKSWIKNILLLRNRNAITITLENILNENYYSKSNLPEIVFMFFQLNNQSLITNEFLTTAFKSISENTTLFESKSDFHIVCSIRAYDLIIILKESPDGSEVNLLRKFNTKFLKRIKVLSWFVQSIILLAIFYEGFEVVSKYPTAKEFIDRIGSVLKALGIIGLSQIGNLFPVLRRKSYEIMLKLFGYPNVLIENLNKKGQE
jgi:hypothetical protein